MKNKPVEKIEQYDEDISVEPVENFDESTVEDDQSASQITELTNDLQRTRADFENFRKQVDLQKTQAMSAAKYATITKFLPLIDDIDRAIAAYPDQLKPLEKNLSKTLKNLGLQKIDSAPGTEFNPDFHEAISVEDDDGDIEVVSETLRPGYLYDGAVVRVAMVKVNHVKPTE